MAKMKRHQRPPTTKAASGDGAFKVAPALRKSSAANRTAIPSKTATRNRPASPQPSAKPVASKAATPKTTAPKTTAPKTTGRKTALPSKAAPKASPAHSSKQAAAKPLRGKAPTTKPVTANSPATGPLAGKRAAADAPSRTAATPAAPSRGTAPTAKPHGAAALHQARAASKNARALPVPTAKPTAPAKPQPRHIASAGKTLVMAATGTEPHELSRPAVHDTVFSASAPPAKNGRAMSKKNSADMLGLTLPAGYRPTEHEPFMGPMQRLYFRSKLLQWKDDIIKQNRETLQVLHDETLQHSDMADRANSEAERALELRARDRQRKLVSKIDAAVTRIDDGSYGYCEETGEPISLKRLDARPIATMSLEAQERHERREKVYRED